MRKGSGEKGKLVFVDSSTLTKVASATVAPDCSVVRLRWSAELNQIAVGCNDGVCRVFYDPGLSRKGALLCATKHKKVDALDLELYGSGPGGLMEIKTPHALPLYREEASKITRKRFRQAYAPDKTGLPTKMDQVWRAVLRVTAMRTGHCPQWHMPRLPCVRCTITCVPCNHHSAHLPFLHRKGPSAGGGGGALLNRHQVGGVSRSPDGQFAQQEREPIRGRPAVRGKRTYGGRPGQCVKEQGTWASRTQKHSEAGYGRPVDRGDRKQQPGATCEGKNG